MAKQIVNQQKPDFQCMESSLLSAVAQIRMMRAYVSEHIDYSTDGPNEGNAAPDLIYQCDALIGSLEALYDDIAETDSLESAAGPGVSGVGDAAH